MRRVLLFVLLASSAVHAEALGVRDLIQRAVARNPSLASATADIGIATGAVRAAAGLDDFILDAGATWTHSRTGIVENSVDTQIPSSDDVTLQLGLAKPLPTGGTIALIAVGDWSRTEFSFSGESQQITTYAPSVNLALTHPLLFGAGKAVARAAQARAAAQKDVSVLAQLQAATTAIRDVIAGYWEVAFAVTNLDIARQAAAAGRDQLERTEANIRVGKLPPSASAEVKVYIALREEEALQAERFLLDRSMDLRELAGMDIGTEEVITNTDTLEAIGEVVSFDRAVALARDRNPDLLVARGRRSAAVVEVEASDTRPTLDLAVNGGPSGNAERASDALEQMGKFKNYSVLASLTFRDALGRNAQRGAYDSARFGVQKAKVSIDQVERQVLAAVARTRAALSEARRRIATIQPAIGQASLDLEAERARFELGRATNFDVLRRQEQLYTTQLRLARAHADFLQAEAVMQALTGELLPRYGVSVSGTAVPTDAP